MLESNEEQKESHKDVDEEMDRFKARFNINSNFKELTKKKLNPDEKLKVSSRVTFLDEAEFKFEFNVFPDSKRNQIVPLN